MRLSPVIFAGCSFVALALAAWLIAMAVVARVETDAREQAVTALAAAGQNWASADPDGMRLVLTGEAPDDAAKFDALEVLGRVIDGTRIDDRSSVASALVVAAPEFALEIQRSPDSLTLIGLAPKSGESDLQAALAALAGPAADLTLLELVDAPAPPLWGDALAFALRLLPQVEQGMLRVTPGHVEVNALARADADRAALEAGLAAQQPETVALTLSISSPLPVLAPYRFAMNLRDGTATVSACAAETGEGRARILSAVRRAGATELPVCTLAMGAPGLDWPEAVDLAITGLGELGGGSLRFTGTAIVLTALPEADIARLDQLRADLQSSLPPLFSLTASLPETAEDDAIPYHPLFSATLHSDGAMSLSGALPDPATKAAVATFAASLLQFGQVQDRAQVDGKLPEGWTARVLAGIETLSLLNSGTLTVSPERLYVEGRGASPDIEAEVNDALKAQLGGGQEFSTLVVTDPSLAKEIAPPANKECAAEVAEILAARQISFAPNSGKIAEESQPVIDDIGIVLKNCATASFEIGGHTDSQGGEVLNQALSQARADAVLDALLDRDVLIARMTARGYGESQPIGDNETEDGRARNRRIAFKLLENADEPD